jgi:hypothetical protein
MWEIKGVPAEIREEYSSRAAKSEGLWGLRLHFAVGTLLLSIPAGQKSTRPACV